MVLEKKKRKPLRWTRACGAPSDGFSVSRYSADNLSERFADTAYRGSRPNHPGVQLCVPINHVIRNRFPAGNLRFRFFHGGGFIRRQFCEIRVPGKYQTLHHFIRQRLFPGSISSICAVFCANSDIAHPPFIPQKPRTVRTIRGRGLYEDHAFSAATISGRSLST